MDRPKNAAPTDFDLLTQLKALSFLSPVALHELAIGLNSASFRKGELILPEEKLADGVHILLRGVAKITCQNPAGRRVTIALLAPGPIPQFVSMPIDRRHFRCEAQSDCRVGSVSWDQFDVITRDASRSDLRKFHENILTQWHRFFDGSLDLRERLLFTLLQLCSIFGVKDSRGTLLRVFLSHQDLAGLVGATRPRITEHIAELEREHLLIREGRQIIVRLDKLESSIGIAPRKTSDPLVRVDTQPKYPNLGQFYSPVSRGANEPTARV